MHPSGIRSWRPAAVAAYRQARRACRSGGGANGSNQRTDEPSGRVSRPRPGPRRCRSCWGSSASCTSTAATFVRTCSALVAPNRTLASCGWSQGVAEGQVGRCDAPLLGEAGERRGDLLAPAGERRVVVGARPVPPSRYLPVSVPPASTKAATRPTPPASRVRRASPGRWPGRAGPGCTPSGPRRAAGHPSGRRRRGPRRSGPPTTSPCPSARPTRGEEAGDLADHVGDGQVRRRRDGVDQIDVVEAHPPQRAVELGGRVCSGQCSHHSLLATVTSSRLPTGGAEQLAEDDLGVPGRDRRGTRLVVVAGVVEEVDAGLAGGAHHGDAVVAAGSARTCATSRAT